MFQKISLFLVCILVISCSSNNDSSPACKLLSVKTTVLFNEDLSISSGYNPNFSGKINFEYDANNKLVKVNGGVRPSPPGQFLTNWYYDDAIVDLVDYSGDTIKVHYNSASVASNVKAFKLNSNGKLLYKKETKGLTTNEYNYTYNGNTISESKNGYPYRTFTLNDGNLISIVQLFYNSNNEIVIKKEHTFLNYDSTENLLKGKYYINGAFFRAFSKNNFQRMEINEYNYVDGNYVPNGNYFIINIPLTYTSENIADVFERSCGQ